MKKLLRYLVNTILFVVIWFIPTTLFVGWSFSVNGTRPSGLIAIGGIVAIIISYKLVKRINKTKLWARLFDETELANDVVDKRKEQSAEFLEKNIDVPKKAKKIISKGWLRLHIIFSLLLPIVQIIDAEGDLDAVGFSIVYIVIYWLIVGAVVWAIRGFREDK
jgi:hypothetical protein